MGKRLVNVKILGFIIFIAFCLCTVIFHYYLILYFYFRKSEESPSQLANEGGESPKVGEGGEEHKLEGEGGESTAPHITLADLLG